MLGPFWPVNGLLWPLYQFLKLFMCLFDLVLTGSSEIDRKLQTTVIFQRKTAVLTILGHFWPVFGLLWPQYQFPKLKMRIFDLVLPGLSEVGKTF